MDNKKWIVDDKSNGVWTRGYEEKQGYIGTNTLEEAKLIAAAPEMYKALKLILNDTKLMNNLSIEQVKAMFEAIRNL